MKTTLALALAAATAVAGCNDPDDPSRHFLPGSIGGGGGSDSPLPDPRVAFLGEITSPKMLSARALALGPDGAIFVADPLGQAVHKFSPRGEPAGLIKAAMPLGVAVDGAGRVFVSEATKGAVRIFDAFGAPLGYLGAGEGEFRYPTGLAWDPTDDTILVADREAHAIKVYSTSGTARFAFGTRGSADGQLARPIDVLVDDDGARYFVVDAGNSRIQSFDRVGAHLDTFGSRGSGKGKLTSPAGIALDREGRLYVTDAYQSILQALDTSGFHVAYVGEYGKTYAKLYLSTDAVIDSHNRLFVASYRTKKVVIYGIDDFTQPQPEPPPLTATIALMPPTLNGRSRAEYVHAIIDLPEYDVRDIDVASIRLHGVTRVLGTPVSYDDANGDEEEDLMVRFSRAELLAAVPGPGTHTLPFVAKLASGRTVVGEAIANVLEEAE